MIGLHLLSLTSCVYIITTCLVVFSLASLSTSPSLTILLGLPAVSALQKMAEQIPFDIIADVLTKLGSSAIQQIGSAFGVAKELRKLTKKLTTIKGVLVDAEKRQEESDAVKAWLQRGGVARQVSDFFSSSNQLVFSFKMSSRVKNIKEEVDEIVKEMNLLNLVQGNIVSEGGGE
ncbi:hypothetical protein CK203_099203 [Vitis vinifera]|uniref:Disease resistance N-terminal domain-containing protein n=1 Tax=Vitis vinifera TaxID=29760 RepID=A0A438DMN4_VITVI|nr:hypothetical protein CK203_099203 [Vitis vinifera]